MHNNIPGGGHYFHVKFEFEINAFSFDSCYEIVHAAYLQAFQVPYSIFSKSHIVTKSLTISQ